LNHAGMGTETIQMKYKYSNIASLPLPRVFTDHRRQLAARTRPAPYL
jgi:hypothetical protein